MAVKKHELVADNRNQLDLAALAQYFQLMNEQPGYLPPPQELIKHCHDIVKCLARTAGTVDQLWQLLQPVEHFLLRVVTTVHCNVRHEIFTAILDKFYSYISDPQSEACPATAAILIVLDESDEEAALSSARWLVQRTENGPAGPGLRAALSCLYRWLHDWHSTPALGFWIVSYIKALEENDHHDLLIETSLDNLARLFSCLANPQPIHQNTANVIFHVLASLRESVEAFDRISSMVGDVLLNLASDSGPWSRQLLQDLVDILSVMVDRITGCLKGDAQEMFRDKYADVILCLERHLESRTSKFLQITTWPRRRRTYPGKTGNIAMKKVGLMNSGNSCYMNSVIQALLVARRFSTHALRKALTVPYWEKMGELFAHMLHSNTSKLDPDRFFKYLRPPFFTSNNQHDSSEFLGYLLELLQSYEHSRETNHDYTRPPVLNGANRWRIHPHAQLSPLPSSPDEQGEPGQSRRSLSPRPGSSGDSGSSGMKRPSSDSEDLVPVARKRSRVGEATVSRRDSIIDSMFGGVLVTRVQCTVCNASSLSRDVFRDLQLAFPDMPEGRQHSVQSLLNFYCSEESMSGENQYLCHDCDGLRDAARRVLVETTPKYLILVLKHFRFDSKNQEQAKLMHAVYYNNNVTLPTVRTQAVHASYNLFAAVVHAGTTLDLGHYYTLAKDNGIWHKYDDCLVSPIDDSYLNKLNRSSTPYILFYRRSDIEEPAAPRIEELPRTLQDEISAENKNHEEQSRKARLGRP
ncbi:ubiquitin carboxyl-terminal hydrolase 35 [Maniola hyperantus]|uniref:ubiquitin carboxyl-terminal hydrolase 35 n=1 Tax=Aphantopus hyperantus TaxID=2795564 RepID=UPI001568DCDA|nr:ubiquitin carboxyl-terminal hydrolase 35 [Maniola hyperantus]